MKNEDPQKDDWLAGLLAATGMDLPTLLAAFQHIGASERLKALELEKASLREKLKAWELEGPILCEQLKALELQETSLREQLKDLDKILEYKRSAP